MKHYTIEAESEAERAMIVDRIKHFNLEENLVIKHKQETPWVCPTDVQCVVKNGDTIINTKKEGLHRGLKILIDEDEPVVIANNCNNCFMDARGKSICIGYEDTMVMVCFKGHMYNTIFNEKVYEEA